MSQSFRQAIKPWMLPIAMAVGALLHNHIQGVAFLSPWLIFAMLVITYCRVPLREFRPGRYALWLLLAQFGGAVAVYYALRPFDELLAQAAFICVYCPTATAAPVITGMLGGNVARTAIYGLISHIFVAFTAPALLTMMNPESQAGFVESMTRIAETVFPLILGPLAISVALQAFAPKARACVASHQGLSFYIWAVSLIIVVGNAVSFVMQEPPSLIPQELAMAGVALAVCLLQFWAGRKIGDAAGDAVSGTQSFGQKNTVLGLWLAMTYLNPITSVAPAAYIAYHNTINAWQIWRKGRSGK